MARFPSCLIKEQGLDLIATLANQSELSVMGFEMAGPRDDTEGRLPDLRVSGFLGLILLFWDPGEGLAGGILRFYWD